MFYQFHYDISIIFAVVFHGIQKNIEYLCNTNIINWYASPFFEAHHSIWEPQETPAAPQFLVDHDSTERDV
ncbi:MAG TPA: hypothetical protein DCE41_16725 [Cytophagales bacterium]|nr:hypothetical protein [Cytophagales bacterium]